MYFQKLTQQSSLVRVGCQLLHHLFMSAKEVNLPAALVWFQIRQLHHASLATLRIPPPCIITLQQE